MANVVTWTCVAIVIIFFIGMFCGTTKWFDKMMQSIINFLTGK